MRDIFASLVLFFLALTTAACGCGGDGHGEDADAAEDAPADREADGVPEVPPEPVPDEILSDGDDPGPDPSDDEEAADTVADDAAADEIPGTPPSFSGLYAAYPCDARVVLEWREAAADAYPVAYRVFLTTTPGVYDWGAPVLETEALEASVDGLANGEAACFVVRAVDAGGRTEDNTVEVCTTPRNAYPVLPHRELVYEVNPALLPSCHSSCIVELPGGELFTIWYCGQSEHTDDVAIWGSRRVVGADAWSFPEVVMDTPGLPDGNDVLYLGRDGRLWIFWALQVAFEWPSAVIKMSVSDDHGLTWGPVSDFGTGGGYLPRTHPKTLDNGWIIVPLYVEYSASAVMVRSEDGGLTWEAPTSILPFLGTQPTVIQRSDLSLFAMMRSGSPPQKSWKARSTDRGLTWGERALSPLDNPGSSLEMVTLETGDVAVAFNNSTDSRSNLSLGLSYDEGETWPVIKAIEDHTEGGYDYPSIIQDACGLIHVSYSWNSRTSIAHVVADEAWMEAP